jgi:hypothetical protein
VADLNDLMMCCSKNSRDQWIEWDFKSVQIESTHYSIRANGDDTGHNHLQNWVLEGQSQEQEWCKPEREESPRNV